MKVALVLLTEPVGAARFVVSGAIVSTVQVRVAGVASWLPAASTARTWKVCDALREAGVACGAAAEGAAVELALERRRRLGRIEREGRAGAADRAGRADQVRGVGRDRVDGPRARGGRGVLVAGGVDGADAEGVRALREPGVACGAAAEAAAIELALERRRRLGRIERERRAGVGDAAARAVQVRRVGRDGVDRPGPCRGGGVLVAGGVDGADAEGVRALREPGIARGAAPEPSAVELALERRRGLGRIERERRARARHAAGRAVQVRGVGRDGVDGPVRVAGVASWLPAASTARTLKVCEPCESPV